MLEFNSNILVRNYFFLKYNITSERAVSNNVLYYQQFSTARYEVSFYAKNYFEKVSIVSSAFNFPNQTSAVHIVSCEYCRICTMVN